jgi:hypothetical protein
MLCKKQNRLISLIIFMILIFAGIVYAVNCWVFQFSGSSPYPNPAGSGSQVKETMNLCVLGDDFQTYPALIRSRVYNYLGQQVYERTEEHSSSPSFQMVVWVVGDGVASGKYTIKTRAESDICGNSGWDQRSVTIVN